METCKNCKWWNISFDRDCEFVHTIHAESEPTRFEIELIESFDCVAEVFLKTGPDFGCIHFGRKDK